MLSNILDTLETTRKHFEQHETIWVFISSEQSRDNLEEIT